MLITFGTLLLFFVVLVVGLQRIRVDDRSFSNYVVGDRSFDARYQAMSFLNSWYPGAMFTAFGGMAVASGVISFYVLVLFVAVFGLVWVEDAPLEALAFEAISAIGTVGLSTGVTGGLTNAGKAAIIALMFMGRVGVLTFGLALAANVRRGPGERAGPDDLIY